jgi:hypothetical protein
MPAAALLALSLAAAPDLLTTAERSGFERTGRYDEVERLCAAYPRAFPGRVRCFELGRTPEGRPMLALAASADGTLTPAAARSRGRTVVVFQGGIHAGEIDGKDAGFVVLRELLASRDGGPLRRVTAVFVPVFNVDGHERFGPDHRPNQRGPAEAGWRTTAQNLNLNRDYVKAEAPETRAMLRLLGEWDPIVYADLHVTDGAKFEHDVAVMVLPRFGYSEALRAPGNALSAALLERLRASGHLPLDFYPSLVAEGDPASGFSEGEARPWFAHGYWAARNRIGILLETHSWHPYPERVRSTEDFLRALLDLSARDGAAWREAARRADAEDLSGARVALSWKRGDASRKIAFRGWAYRRTPSAASGRTAVVYDEGRPELWNVPLYGPPGEKDVAVLPRGGWIVPAAHAGWVAERLRLHAVEFETLAGARPGLAVEMFRAESVKWAAESLEGRHTLEAKGAWGPGRRDVAPGALFVPVRQPRARLAAVLLEPSGPDGLLAWGFFDAAFERKEYIEPYVLEAFAADLLARDAAVREEFLRRLADPAFAADPEARLDFFYALHPARDAEWRVYPVLRVDRRP